MPTSGDTKDSLDVLQAWFQTLPEPACQVILKDIRARISSLVKQISDLKTQAAQLELDKGFASPTQRNFERSLMISRLLDQMLHREKMLKMLKEAEQTMRDTIELFNECGAFDATMTTTDLATLGRRGSQRQDEQARLLYGEVGLYLLKKALNADAGSSDEVTILSDMGSTTLASPAAAAPAAATGKPRGRKRKGSTAE